MYFFNGNTKKITSLHKNVFNIFSYVFSLVFLVIKIPYSCHDDFSSISQTVDKLEVCKLYSALRQAIEGGRKFVTKATLSVHNALMHVFDICRKIKSITKPNSSIPGDIPKTFFFSIHTRLPYQLQRYSIQSYSLQISFSISIPTCNCYVNIEPQQGI